MLIEGVPMRGSISAQNGELVYKIQLNQLEGFEQPFKVSVSPIVGKFRIRVSFGVVPNNSEYGWTTYENSLTISPKDKGFKGQGTYYVLITPKVSFLDVFKFSFSSQYYLSYVTEDSFTYL